MFCLFLSALLFVRFENTGYPQPSMCYDTKVLDYTFKVQCTSDIMVCLKTGPQNRTRYLVLY